LRHWQPDQIVGKRANGLRTRAADAPQLLAHVMAIEFLDGVPVRIRFIGHFLDCDHIAALTSANVERKALCVDTGSRQRRAISRASRPGVVGRPLVGTRAFKTLNSIEFRASRFRSFATKSRLIRQLARVGRDIT